MSDKLEAMRDDFLALSLPDKFLVIAGLWENGKHPLARTLLKVVDQEMFRTMETDRILKAGKDVTHAEA